MPNAPKTPIRSIRCDPEPWDAARKNLAPTGTDISSAIRRFVAAIAAAEPAAVVEILKQFPPQ